MKISINPGPRSGIIEAPASKSQCNRLFLLAALGDKIVNIACGGLSDDLRALVSCLETLGSGIKEPEKGIFSVSPIDKKIKRAELNCGESGSCLRFLLPVMGVLEIEACLHMEGRLSERPIEQFSAELCRHGMKIEKRGTELYCSGKLQGGSFELPGNCSSQYISALLMALPLLDTESEIHISGELQSAPYIAMTEEALGLGGIKIRKSGNSYIIPGGGKISLPENIEAEGDYSSAAFFLCMGALSSGGIEVKNLRPDSVQGDRGILNILRRMGAEVIIKERSVLVRRSSLRGTELNAAQIPDLVPAFSALAALAEGESRVINASRLRFKESDRLKTTCAMLRALGADIEEQPDGLIISGKKRLSGGEVKSCNDHRISMAAAIAACGCENKIIIEGSEAVNKSYPDFWKDFGSLKEIK